MLWGECIDASKAKPYELPDKEEPFDDPTVTMTPVPSSTKVLVKPTHNLPPDHGTANGEADKPAFNNGSSSTPTPTPFPANPADEGYFTHITDLVGSNRWLFGAFGIVALFGVGSGLFLWRRRRQARQRRSGDYSALPGDAVPMGSLERGSVSGPRSKELYDAFGEVSDEEDDENAGLVRRTEDELIRPYRDAPESPEGPTTTTAASSSTATVVPSQQQQQHRDDGSVSSTDGSWVDAR
jgi:kexin